MSDETNNATKGDSRKTYLYIFLAGILGAFIAGISSLLWLDEYIRQKIDEVPKSMEIETEKNIAIQEIEAERKAAIDLIDDKLSSSSSERASIKECRVCFKETEGSNQCQKSRNSCSGWSLSPDWTDPFRDDTDNKGGGCTYQWKLECR